MIRQYDWIVNKLQGYVHIDSKKSDGVCMKRAELQPSMLRHYHRNTIQFSNI